SLLPRAGQQYLGTQIGRGGHDANDFARQPRSPQYHHRKCCKYRIRGPQSHERTGDGPCNGESAGVAMKPRSKHKRPGFTLLEMMVVCFLTVLLGALLSVTWSGLCRPAADISSRACMTQEANLAAASFVRDLGGFLANPEGRIGTKYLYPFVGRMQPGGTQRSEE